VKRLSVLITMMLTVGCAQVQPWEKAYLAKAEMQFGQGGVTGRVKEHVRYSKEAAHGDITLSAGGCGCN